MSNDSGNASSDFITNKAGVHQNGDSNQYQCNNRRSVDSFSSLDETDFQTDLIDKFRYLATNGYHQKVSLSVCAQHC